MALAAVAALATACLARMTQQPLPVFASALSIAAAWWSRDRWRRPYRPFAWNDGSIGATLDWRPPVPRLPLSASRDLGQPVRRRPRAVPPAVLAPGERFEAVILSPPSLRDAPLVAPDTDATIHALFARLERDVGRGGAAASGPLADTLDELRRLARRGAA